MDYELTLFDRIEVIKTANKKYDLEHNAYISFSGGKDSTIVHHLIDMALPNNRIPRVFINTGIEYNDIVAFVKEMAEKDDRFVILKPSVPIKPMLEKYGYPFKSKQHAHNWEVFVNNRKAFFEAQKQIEENPDLLNDYNFIHNLPLGLKTIIKYYYGVREKDGHLYLSQKHSAPKVLQYQFTDKFNLHISDLCCKKMKKEPIHKWEKENNRSVAITGMRAEEGGTRSIIKGCILTDDNGNLKKFHPLLKVDDAWEDEFVSIENIKLCKLYYPPYNFKRTGCRFCPFSLTLQEQLETAYKLMPNEAKAGEIIWKPVFDEYRRLGYRLKPYIQMTLDFEEEGGK